MGETGCGKTRLIKYMCELLSLNSPDSTTLVIMKVIYRFPEDKVCKGRMDCMRRWKIQGTVLTSGTTFLPTAHSKLSFEWNSYS